MVAATRSRDIGMRSDAAASNAVLVLTLRVGFRDQFRWSFSSQLKTFGADNRCRSNAASHLEQQQQHCPPLGLAWMSGKHGRQATPAFGKTSNIIRMLGNIRNQMRVFL